MGDGGWGMPQGMGELWPSAKPPLGTCNTVATHWRSGHEWHCVASLWFGMGDPGLHRLKDINRKPEDCRGEGRR